MSSLNPDHDYAMMELAVLRRENPGGVLWQPRIDYWYQVNKKRGTLPAHLRTASLWDVYDYCHASRRYYIDDVVPVGMRYDRVEVTQTWETDKRLRTTWHTAVGAISQVAHYDEWDISSHLVEYRIKTVADLAVLNYLYRDETWYLDEAALKARVDAYGRYGPPQFYFRRSPFQRLILSEMGFEATIYFVNDHPDLLADYIAWASAADDPMYDLLCQSSVQILNLGENIDGFLNAPQLFTRYLVPYYQQRIAQLHAAGKLVYIHMDGALRPLLPHLRDCPWDAIEAATPVPQGDVTLEAIKAGFGHLILFDGIPALFFLPQYSLDVLMTCAQQVVDLFYPHLVLGISDELPPDGDIERVRQVGEWAASLDLDP